MLIVKVFEINANNKIIMPGKIIYKWDKDNQPTFDITNPNMWRLFIKKYCKDIIREKGSYNLRWQVYNLGGNPPLINFFPGYDKNGKVLDINKYGVI